MVRGRAAAAQIGGLRAAWGPQRVDLRRTCVFASGAKQGTRLAKVAQKGAARAVARQVGVPSPGRQGGQLLFAARELAIASLRRLRRLKRAPSKNASNGRKAAPQAAQPPRGHASGNAATNAAERGAHRRRRERGRRKRKRLALGLKAGGRGARLAQRGGQLLPLRETHVGRGTRATRGAAAARERPEMSVRTHLFESCGARQRRSRAFGGRRCGCEAYIGSLTRCAVLRRNSRPLHAAQRARMPRFRASAPFL